MKIKLFCGIGVSLLILSACTEEKFSYEAPDVNSADLIEGKAYSVTIDPETNLVTLKNLLGDNYVASWVTPNGITKGSEVSFSLPFSGDYEVQFGVMTRGGMVYGNPYTFSLPYNNFSLLSDEIWTNLAGGVEVEDDGTVISNPVTWVPMNQKFGKHNGSAPVTYLSPDDVHNNGTGDSDLKFGTDNWTENWDPGFQSWLIDSDNPYMDSEMTMYLDAQKGCVAEIKRVTSAGETNYTTTFNLNISDPDRPTVTFNQGDMLYAEWGNGMCANYSTDIKLIECTPYVLQFATMRTNSEGPWWIVWNFIRKELKEDPSLFPTDGPELQEVSNPKLPSYENLEQLLFTIVGDDATYLSTQTTLVMDEDKPYDIYYWNNAGQGNWEWMNAYGSSWAPAYGGADDFTLTLSKKWEDLDNDGVKESPYFEAVLDNPENTKTTRFTIGENSITFNEPLIFMSAGNYLMRAREFTVLRCAPEDEEIILGIPDGFDANNNCNRYLAVGLKIKGVSGGPEGPTIVEGDNAKLGVYIEASDHLRLELYNPWGSNNWFNDISKLKIKKNQTATINFKVEGIDWKDGAQPRVLFANNVDALGFSWPSKGEGFDQDHTILNTATGEGTATLTNTTGGTITFEGAGCVTICIEITGLTNTPIFDEDNGLDEGVKGEIISFSIQ
ncbi:MAG: hypothetical protein J1F38_02360 [Muribaculaceae bacterium]|nr:hypothetical protein [Muribaculaceae bacterium]